MRSVRSSTSELAAATLDGLFPAARHPAHLMTPALPPRISQASAKLERPLSDAPDAEALRDLWETDLVLEDPTATGTGTGAGAQLARAMSPIPRTIVRMNRDLRVGVA